VTIRQKISLIARFLRERGRSTFHTFLAGARSRLDIVVTFLAMLELIKLSIVQVHQEKIFGDIEIETLGTWDEEKEIELEFEE
jgi:segregation and condensation protein A